MIDDSWWQFLTVTKIELLGLKAAPLLRFASTGNLAEAFFTSKMERLGLMLLQQKDITENSQEIKEDVDLLPRNLSQVAPHVPLINDIISNQWWDNITVKKLNEARKTLAPLMKYRR